jgi:hypothetical protein
VEHTAPLPSLDTLEAFAAKAKLEISEDYRNEPGLLERNITMLNLIARMLAEEKASQSELEARLKVWEAEGAAADKKVAEYLKTYDRMKSMLTDDGTWTPEQRATVEQYKTTMKELERANATRRASDLYLRAQSEEKWIKNRLLFCKLLGGIALDGCRHRLERSRFLVRPR